MCADGVGAIDAIRGKACSDCGERVLSSYAENRYTWKARDSEAMIPMADVRLRIRENQPQIGLTSRQRRENLRGAFAVAIAAAEVTEREMLLLDDLYTAAITATGCAKVLRRAGAAKVGVARVARKLKLASKYEEIPEGFKVSELAGFGRPRFCRGSGS